MKNSAKKVIVVGGVALMVGATLPQNINAMECTKMDTDIVIRVGEYPNKPGKRLDNVHEDFDIGVPVRYDNGRYCVQEYDLNYKVANAIVK